MRIGLSAAWILAVAVSLVSTSSALAFEGTVVDADDQPIEGAVVCYIVGNRELLCGETDPRGRFSVPSSGLDTLRARAEGYNPVIFSGAKQQTPIVLERAPVLTVRLTDGASGEAISEGEVVVSYASGKEKGPFPVNAAGVRVRTGLVPGEVRILGRAEGYEDSELRSVNLVAGDAHTVVLELTPSERSEKSDGGD